MIVEPFEIPVTTPELLTEATDGFEELAIHSPTPTL
jgi:hypothetical protein